MKLKVTCQTQEEFNNKFEKTVERMDMSWDLLKEIIVTYPEYYNEYARTHNYKLNIRRRSKCDGCEWNDGCPHGACWSCDD